MSANVYIRVYLLTASFCTAKTSLLFYFLSIRGRSDTLRIFRSNILLSQILLLHGNTAFENNLLNNVHPCTLFNDEFF